MMGYLTIEMKHSVLVCSMGVWAPTYVSTEQHYMPESTTTEGAPVAEGLYRRRPTPLETQEKKNDRDRSTLTTGYSKRVHISRRSIPGKIWMPTNQIKTIAARAHVYRQLRARALQASRGI